MREQTIAALCLFLSGASAWAQLHPGAPFGARDPAICGSRKSPAKGAPTADQAKEYFYCDSEALAPATYGGRGGYLYLVTAVKIEVGNARPFNILTDSKSAIDPKQPVYDTRGSYAKYQCMTPDSGGGGTYPIGKNCIRRDFANAGGICYKYTFADWHCVFSTGDAPRITPTGLPAPGR